MESRSSSIFFVRLSDRVWLIPGTLTLQNKRRARSGLLTLNGASISVTVNGVTTHPAIYYTSPTQIAGVAARIHLRVEPEL